MFHQVPIGDVTVSTSCTCVANYQWPVENFWICCNDIGDALLSPEFLAAHDSNPVVMSQLVFYPKGMTERVQDYFSLFLRIVTTTAEITDVSLSILNNGVELTTRRFRRPTRNDATLWGAEDFMNRNLIKDGAIAPSPVDSLTIVLRIHTRKRENEMSALQVRKNNDCLENEDYEQLVDDEAFSDVELTIGDKSLRAHKCILSARSPIFADMFKGNKEQSRVEVVGLSYQVCLEMLRYIYSENIKHLELIDYELLAAADKFGLEDLKRVCERSLSKDVNVDNVVKKILYAYWHGAEMLKFVTIGFIHRHEADLIHKPEYRTLPRNILMDVLYSSVNRTR